MTCLPPTENSNFPLWSKLESKFPCCQPQCPGGVTTAVWLVLTFAGAPDQLLDHQLARRSDFGIVIVAALLSFHETLGSAGRAPAPRPGVRKEGDLL